MRPLVFAFILAPMTLLGQAPPSRCASPLYRGFDFWVGEWSVSDTAGHVVGASTIERAANGCVISEHWKPLQGADGVSINWVSGDGKWNQQWVGGGGWIARFKGGMTNGEMIIQEVESTVPDSSGTNRMRYRLQPDGKVRQTVETSKDRGLTWATGFVGLYSRK
ncbi:MAG TPA: hypothetical protein VGI83_01315 [Gemmatimonadales bacterium]|jgi:hypothetical protein